MYKLYSFLAGIGVVILLLAGTVFYIQNQNSNSQGNELIIYNWGDYIDPDLLTKFTNETGIQVQYETFDSNEAMYTKIKQGGTTYDIAIPSDYMIDKMKKEDLLVPLDKSQIKGLDAIDPQFLNQNFDKNNIYFLFE